LAQDKQLEIEHGKNITKEAEFFWGWDTPAGRLRFKRRSNMIIDALKNRGFFDLLEVGSGTGIFTKEFCKNGFSVTGIDISKELLDKARERYSNYKNLKLEVADVEDMKFSDESFDAVCGICVLHHLDIVPSLKEIYRVLKKGGVVLFSEPNMMNPQLMIQKNIKPIKRLKILGETEDETAFFRWQMHKVLADIGFSSISVKPFDFLHPWTPKSLIPYVEKLGSLLEKTPVLKEISGSLFIYAVK